MKWKLLAIVAPITLIVDFVTKEWIHNSFQYGESRPVIPGFFDISYVRNMGAAFGMLSKAEPGFREPFFLIVPVLILAFMSYLFHKLPANLKIPAIAYALVIGGAVGNLIDRIRFGFVVDFITLHWQNTYYYPSFNVADAAICVGVALLIFFNPDSEKENASNPV
jgi:signal peptidase II